MKIDSQTIIATARDLVEELGSDKLTLQLLAVRLGVKAPSLYNHIDSIQSLKEAVALLALEDIEDALRDAAVGRSREEALLGMAGAYRAFAKAHPRLYRAMLELSYGESAVREEGRSLLATFYKVLEPYALGEDGARNFSRAFRAALHGFVSLEEEVGFKSSPDTDESFERLVGSLIASLGSYEWGRG